MKFIDEFLDGITMYRLILYYLIILVILAAVMGMIGLLPFSPISFAISLCVILFFSMITNSLFARIFEAPTNQESVYITALILVLIITPPVNISDVVFLAWAGILAAASKYILALAKKHLFNPVAIAVVLTSYGFYQSASWWIGNSQLIIPVIIGGLLIVRKIQREDMIFSFLATTIFITGYVTVTGGGNVMSVLDKVILHSPLFFFTFVMLTEPLTTPPTKILRILYGAFIGILFTPQIRIAHVSFTPETALVAGNIFSYIVSPKEKLLLRLKEKIRISPDTFDFIFFPAGKLNFSPGQYMEWTLPHGKIDSRGNRRYFTLASSPTEDTIRLGIKFNNIGSSYKSAMLNLTGHLPIVAGQRAGDFILPKNSQDKLVFMAGGIGITPFRSMLKYLTDKKENRDIILLYSNKRKDEIVYQDIISLAQAQLGIKVIYTLTDKQSVNPGWKGEVGRIDGDMINKYIPDYPERKFFLSGPHNMVTAFEQVLLRMGISQNRIIRDFFPGFV